MDYGFCMTVRHGGSSRSVSSTGETPDAVSTVRVSVTRRGPDLVDSWQSTLQGPWIIIFTNGDCVGTSVKVLYTTVPTVPLSLKSLVKRSSGKDV